MTRWKVPVMLLLAVIFGAGAMVAAGMWAQGVRRQQPVATAEPPPAPLGTIVVAGSPLRYGTELTARQLRDMPWPAQSVPPGAFKTIAEVLTGNGKRIGPPA